MTQQEAHAKLTELDRHYRPLLRSIASNGGGSAEYDEVWQTWINQAGEAERALGVK